MRSVVRFLDKDCSGTIDVGEVDKAVREFRELVRDTPSLGTGPMTVIDSAEIDRLAARTFADLVAKRSPAGEDSSETAPSATATHNYTSDKDDDDGGGGSKDNKNDGKNESDDNTIGVGYTTGKEGGDGVQFLPAATAGTPTKAEGGVPPAGGEADSDGGDEHEHEEQQPQQNVSVSEISMAFADALRQFNAGGEGPHSGGAMRRTGGAQQPSTDTQHAKVPGLGRP